MTREGMFPFLPLYHKLQHVSSIENANSVISVYMYTSVLLLIYRRHLDNGVATRLTPIPSSLGALVQTL